MDGPSAMEQAAPNAAVRVCFASLEKREKMEDQPLYGFLWKTVERTDIWRVWTVPLYSSRWEQMMRLKTLLVPPDEVSRLARTTRPKAAPLNPVSTPTQDK